MDMGKLRRISFRWGRDSEVVIKIIANVMFVFFLL